MTPRLHLDPDVCGPLHAGTALSLPPGPARHAQVLRLQPGDAVTLFDGHGGEWSARVAAMGRRDVRVDVEAHRPVDRELAWHVCLAVGMPANERMDSLVEKATELGVASLQPLMCERAVLRLDGERADRKRDHWQAVAVAAAEQSGRTRVPRIEPVRRWRDWLGGMPRGGQGDETRWLLSLHDEAGPLGAAAARVAAPGARIVVGSGPEGGLSADEEALAMGAGGFVRVSLGARVLRADTAPLAEIGRAHV